MTAVSINFEKGCKIKALFEVLSNFFTRGCISFTKNSVKFVDCDSNQTILFHVSLEKEKIVEYMCKEQTNAQINFTSICTSLKDVKKPDSVKMVVDNDNVKVIHITPFMKVLDTIVYKSENTPSIIELPSKEEYDEPFIVRSNCLSQIKKISQNNKKEIKIYMIGNQYIKFTSENIIHNRAIEYGNVPEKYLEDEDVFKATFKTKIFSSFTKMPGLHEYIRIFRPKNEGIPLKIEVNIGEMGVLAVFVKDEETIQQESEIE